MDKEEVLKTVIEAITVIEENPQQHLTDYKICEALYQARDYFIDDYQHN